MQMANQRATLGMVVTVGLICACTPSRSPAESTNRAGAGGPRASQAGDNPAGTRGESGGAADTTPPSGPRRAAGTCPVVPAGDAAVPVPTPDGGADAGSAAPLELADWSSFGFDGANTRDNRFETQLSVQTVAKLEPRWTTPVGAGSGGLTSTPTVVGDTVYVCEHPGVLAAYAAHTGALTWRQPGLGVIRCGTPLVTEDRIYVSVGDAMHARRRSDGAAIWSTAYGVKLPLPDGSPVMAGDRIVVGVGTFEVINSPPYSAQGIIVAFEQDGTEAWRVTPAAFPAGMETTGISVWSSPAVDPARRLIFIGTGQAYQAPAGPNSDAIMAIDYETGVVRWVNQFHANDVYTDRAPGARMDWDIGAAPNLFVVDGVDAVGAGSKGALYRAINRDTGATIWDRDLGNPSALGGVMAAAAVADGRIFVAHRTTGLLDSAGASQLRALNVGDGKDAWAKPVDMAAFTWGAISHANGVVYTSIQNGTVYAIEASTGAQLWSTKLGNGAAGGPSISNGWLYVPSGYTGLGDATAGADLNAFSLGASSNSKGAEAGTGTAEQSGDSALPRPGAAFAKVMDVLRNQHGCIGGFCHGTSGGLNLQATLVEQYQALLGADCTGAATGSTAQGGRCEGARRVVPGDAAASVLYQKLGQQLTCGDPMPPPGATAAPVSAAEIEVVRAWIDSGAPFE